MPRKRLQREPCDCVDCRDTFPAERAFMTTANWQKPPPKCLVIYAPSCFETGNSQGSSLGKIDMQYPHINAAIENGCTGLLVFQKDKLGPNHSTTNVLQNLLCPLQVLPEPKGKGGTEGETSLRGMFCEIAADDVVLKDWASTCGFRRVHSLPARCDMASLITQRLGLEKLRHRWQQIVEPLPAEDEQADESAELLFLCLDLPEGQQALEKGQIGLHLRAELSELAASGLQEKQDLATSSMLQVLHQQQLETIDRLLRELNRQPEFQEAVLLVLLLGLSNVEQIALPIPKSGGNPLQDCGAAEGFESISRPQQSFEFAGREHIQIDQQSALLSIQRLPSVIRRDHEKCLQGILQGFLPGNGCILAERLMPELAYKLGHAPKYGA